MPALRPKIGPTSAALSPYSDYSWSLFPGGIGGNGISDTAISSESGDIYFYSPEQLDGTHGVVGEQNLYDYRQGRVQYVTTLYPWGLLPEKFLPESR